MHDSRFTRLAGSLLLVAAFAACGEDKRETKDPDLLPAPVGPAIDRFVASPEVIEEGTSTTLSWTARDVVSIEIADQKGNPVSVEGLSPTGGSVTVQPSETTSYTLTATGADPEAGQAWRTITVHVFPAPVESPVIVEFVANPTSVAAGGQVELSWRTTGATMIALQDDGDVPIGVDGADPADGEVTVRPTRSPTVYHLTAVGPGGARATAHVAVEVTGLPRINRFDVTPIAPVHPGDPVTVNWETDNATRVVVRQDGTVLVDTTTELSGSRTVTITDNVLFTIEASGVGEPATADFLAQVGPNVTAFAASERVVRANDPVTLSWSVEDADRAVLDGPGGYQLPIPGNQLASGSATVTVTAPGDFVLQAFRGTVPGFARVAIDVTQAPRIRSLSVDQTQVTASLESPANVNLSWVQDGGEHCTILANGTPVPGYANFPCGPTGTVSVPLTASATLRLVVMNGDGSDSRTVGVEAFAPAKIVSFTSDPNRRLSPGDTVELSWEVTGAVSIALEKDGAALPIGATNFVGSTNDRVLVDSAYVLTAQNTLGFPTRAQLTVRAGAPVILSAVAEPDFVAIGSAFDLKWTADGGDRLAVTGPGGELFATTDPAEIDLGSTQLLAPVEAGEYTYTITVVNGGGTTSRDVLLKASDGPMIRSLVASTDEMSLGESFTLTWSVDDDVAGNTPILALTDNYGHDYTTELAGKDPNNGALTITPEEEGQHVYTFTASTEPDRMMATVTLVVEVTVPPFLHTFTATPDTVSTQGGTVVPEVELAWTSENAVEVAIFKVDEFGNAIFPALHRLSLANGDSQSALDAGTYTTGPTETTKYIARARNRVGTEAEKQIKVIVDPPEILSFVATPSEITEGGTSTISWTTRNTTSVFLHPKEPAIQRLGNTYIDVSTSPTAVAATHITGDYGIGKITFPEGFKFPFGGQDYAEIQVCANGWAGFKLTNTETGGYSSSTLPNNSSRYANFLLYGGDHDNEKNTPFGMVWSDLQYDAQGPMFVVQWKNWSWWSSSYRPSSLNFELVLRPNGNFEYRYGEMTSLDADHAMGKGASIGFQYPETDSFGMYVVPYGTVVPGGLADTGWSFEVASPVNGSMTVTPSGTTTYRLKAINADTSTSAETVLTVWKTPVISFVGTDPVAPDATVPFTIAWTAREANQIRVLDQNGAVICMVTDPAKISNGSCTHVEPTAGPKTYTVEASNGPPGNPVAVVTRTVQMVVMTHLAVTSFEVLPGEFVDPGDQLTINWSSTGATMMELLACAPRAQYQCTNITPAGANPSAGTLTLPATQSAEYRFHVYDPYTRVDSASQSVWVGIATLDTFTASAYYITPGTGVTLSWTSTDADDVSLDPVRAPEPTEVTSTAPFIELFGNGGIQATREADADYGRFPINFPAGFTFPYFGEDETGLIASVDGWITFDMNDKSSNGNGSTFPTGSDLREVHMALFQDDLEDVSPGQVLWKLDQTPEGLRYLVVEWYDWENYFDSGSSYNFEVVLFENGDFDFRYGNMVGTGSYEDDAQGSDATIGYQDPLGKVGYTILNNAEMSGGLGHRSWRFRQSLPADGSMVVTPTESTTYRLCATNESLYKDCKEVRVVVVRPGDLLFTEAMIAPANPEAEWFEIRNLTPDNIDLGGWSLSSGAGELYLVPAPAVIPAGGYAVFARSGDPLINGGLTPTFVYGNALTLVDTTDTLALYFGPTAIDTVTWATGWTIPTTGSLVLDTTKMARNQTVNDAATAWCATTAPYGDGTFTGSPGALGDGCIVGGGHAHYWYDPFAAVPFIDIAGTGVDDSGIIASTYYSAAIPLGFTLPYFGDTVTSMQIGRYGYVAFTPQTSYYSGNSSIPNASTQPNGFVAPFWDYHSYTTGVTTIHHERRTIDGHQVMIVQWTKSAPNSTSYSSADFQVQLWDTGDIAFVYRNLIQLNTTYFDVFGTSATIGIESLDGSLAIQAFYGTSTSGTGPLYNGKAYLFRKKPAPPAP